MTASVVTGNLLNPTSRGLTYGMFPGGVMSQYLDSYSVFQNNSAYAPIAGMGFGFGGVNPAVNNAYFNAMVQNSDNMTTLGFVTRSNQHTLGAYNEIMQKNLVEMATAIREGQMGKASQVYNEIYDAISKNYGRELNNHEDRVEFDQSIRATISNLYQQINGYPLANDINENGEGYFANGFMQGFTLGNHHKNSAEETESYMTGTSIEGYSSKKFVKTLGKITGATVSVGTAAAIGAGVGSAFFGIAAVPGALIGAGIALLSGLISNNSTSKVTSA